VFFHMMGVRIYSDHRVSVGHYPIPRPTMQWVYVAYMAELRASVELMASVGLRAKPQARRPSPEDYLRTPFRWIKRSWMSNRSNQRLNF
jgi:hypothetical protein